jgi:hypothetical protein
VEDASEDSTRQQGYSLIGFDPQAMAYRSWWFNSEGYTSHATGTWNAATEIFSFKSDLEGGLTSHTTGKFADKDHHQVHVVVTDGDGKVYFDTTWTVSRRK